MILKCVCTHEFQDSKYGKGMRVHTNTMKTPLGKVFRCTVCERERNSDSGEIQTKGKKKQS